MRYWLFVAGITALLATACGPGRRVHTRLSEREFGTIMAELARTRPAQRADVLQKYHATEADLREFVQKRAIDPASLSVGFDTAAARLGTPDEPMVPPPH